MIKPSRPKKNRVLKPLPRGLIGVYGFIAVLLVIVPEWIAEFALAINHLDQESKLPKNSARWQKQPELKFALMNMRDLRLLAMKLKIHGYTSDNTKVLSERLRNALKVKTK